MGRIRGGGIQDEPEKTSQNDGKPVSGAPDQTNPGASPQTPPHPSVSHRIKRDLQGIARELHLQYQVPELLDLVGPIGAVAAPLIREGIADLSKRHKIKEVYKALDEQEKNMGLPENPFSGFGDIKHMATMFKLGLFMSDISS